MRWIMALLFVVAPVHAAADSNMTPPLPELRAGVGSPPQPTDAMQRLSRVLDAVSLRGDSFGEPGKMALDSAIVLYPDDPDARFLRASYTFCGARYGELNTALADVDSALVHLGSTPTPQGISLPTAYGLKAQIELALGHDRQALAIIERAIHLSPEDAEDIFNPGTVDPDSATVACKWTRVKLDRLVASNPSDHRAHLARGLYYGFFKRFTTASHPKALEDLLTARRLAPSSPLCRYLLGREYQSGGETALGSLFTGTINAAQQSALREFTGAIALDSRFAPAYAARAELRYREKRFTLAIKDYNALIQLEPNNAGALNDRGLAKEYLGNYLGALEDFAEAARLKTADPIKAAEDETLYGTFENRARCHAALGMFSEAADDMTEALRALLRPLAAAMSLARLRDLFPECASMDNDTFLHTVHGAFCSTIPYATFERMKNDSLLGQLDDFVVPTDYVQRGDYLLRAGNLRAALADYARARRAFPKTAGSTERWRLATANDTQEFYIDSQAEPRSVPQLRTIWVKKQDRRGSRGWSMDAGKIQIEASTTYRADGTVVASNDTGGSPSVIVPDSLGEWFSKAMCQ